MTLPPGELQRRVAAKIAFAFSYRNNVRRVAYALDRYSRRLFDGPYAENEPVTPRNLETKLERQSLGGCFEQPIIVLTNRAAASLIGDARRILEVGAGTGLFASLAAQNANRRVVASEYDEPTRQWAATHRAAPNITYCGAPASSFSEDSFDLAVAIEVIEHIHDFSGFLRDLSRVAPAALLTTPNRHCDPFRSVTRSPVFSEHVREWSAGEFYWVLRAFYANVELFTLPELGRQIAALERDEMYQPLVVTCSDLCCNEPLLARCRDPVAALGEPGEPGHRGRV